MEVRGGGLRVRVGLEVGAAAVVVVVRGVEGEEVYKNPLCRSSDHPSQALPRQNFHMDEMLEAVFR